MVKLAAPLKPVRLCSLAFKQDASGLPADACWARHFQLPPAGVSRPGFPRAPDIHTDYCTKKAPASSLGHGSARAMVGFQWLAHGYETL